MELFEHSAAQLLQLYAARQASPTEVMWQVLARLELARPLNALVHVDTAPALAAAQAAEQRWRRPDEARPLEGVPFTVKDNVRWAGRPCTRGSPLFADAVAPDSAPAVQSLIAAGAIPVAVTAMPDHGCKGVTHGRALGAARNPWDLRYDPGGSSGGAAICAAIGAGPLHIGTDAAGSVRIPAAFCGVVGLKPTFGLVPRHPPSPFRAVVHHGPITRTAEDAGLMLRAMAQPDSRDIDATWAGRLGERGALPRGKVAWSPRLGFVRHLDPEVERLARQAARRLEDLGFEVEEADPPIGDPSEVLFGLWRAGCASLLADMPESRWSLLDPSIVEHGVAGLEMSAVELLRVTNLRDDIHHRMEQFMARYPLVASPTTAAVGIPAGLEVPLQGEGGSDWFSWAGPCYLYNLSQHPAVSLPCGFTSAGLPTGLQLATWRAHDADLLWVAAQLQALLQLPTLVTPQALPDEGAARADTLPA